MTGIAIRFHPEAASEVEAAVDWYTRRSVRAAERVISQTRRTDGLDTTSVIHCV